MFTRQEKFVLFLLAAIQFNHIVDFMIAMPLGPQLMRSFDMSSSEFSLILSSYTFAAGIVGFLGAFFLDRINRRKALIIFNLGFTVGTLLCAFAPTYHWLLILRSVTGCFGGLLQSTLFTTVGDAVPFERRGAAMGIVMTAFSVASVVGVPISLFFANMYSWRTPFIGLGICSALVSLALFLKFPSMNAHIQGAATGVRNIVRSVGGLLAESHTRNTLIFMWLLVFGQFVTVTLLSPSLVFNAGLSETHLSLVYFFGGLCTIFFSPYVGRLVDRFSAYKVAVVTIPISVLPIYWVTHLKPTSEWLILLATSIFFISSNGRMVPAQALATSTVPPQRRGSFMSLNSCVTQLAAGCAALVAGLVTLRGDDGVIQNMNWIGYISMGGSLLGLAVLIWREKRIVTAV